MTTSLPFVILSVCVSAHGRMNGGDMNRLIKVISRISISILIAGAIIFLVGLYYAIIKAGIPYQDPPLELQIEYAVNMGIGEKLIRVGVSTTAIGIVSSVLMRLLSKKYTGLEKGL